MTYYVMRYHSSIDILYHISFVPRGQTLAGGASNLMSFSGAICLSRIQL